MFDLHPPAGPLGVVWTILAYVGAFGILAALIWVNVLIGGLVNGMFMLVSGPLIDKALRHNPKLVALLGKVGLKDLL